MFAGETLIEPDCLAQHPPTTILRQHQMKKAHSHTWFPNVHSETQKLRRQNANVLRLRSVHCLVSHVIVQFPNSRHMYALRTYFKPSRLVVSYI